MLKKNNEPTGADSLILGIFRRGLPQDLPKVVGDHPAEVPQEEPPKKDTKSVFPPIRRLPIWHDDYTQQ
jgi:hypothetical protein